MKENLLSGQDFKQCTRLLIFPESKHEQNYASTLIHGRWLMVGLNDWEHEKDMNGKQVIGGLGKRYVCNSLQMTMEHENISVPCKSSAKSNISRVEILIIRWKR